MSIPSAARIRAGLDSLEPMTIVGIVKDIRTRGPARPVQAEIFMPYEQHQGPATSLNLVLRTNDADPLTLGATAARLIRARNPDVPVRVETMEMTMAGGHRDAALPHRAARGVRCGRTRAGHCRGVWGDGVHREPARAGDWAARGAWRIATDVLDWY